jgi:hypothetical protein
MQRIRYRAAGHLRGREVCWKSIISSSSLTVKSFTNALQQKRNKCSLWQVTDFGFVAELVTAHTQISRQDNAITAPLSHVALAASQDSDDELRTVLAPTISLRLEKQSIPGSPKALSVPVRPRSLAPRHSSNSEAGRTASCVALPYLGTGLPVVPKLQSLPPRSYPSG